MTAPAEVLRAAATKLRTPLPPYYQGTAHVVVEESVFLAVCQWEHTDTQACDSCELIEVHNEEMAGLLAAAINGRERLAHLLECAARSREAAERGAAFVSDESVTVTADQIDSTTTPAALAVARAVLGEAS